ncbi:MAG: hypothetical protein WCD86_19535 [Ktedonobacteraceae bacterium]
MDYNRFPDMDKCKSEVARLRYQIEQEYRAAELAMNGLALGTTRHDFINAKMDRVGECRQQLAQIVGEQEATRICVEVTDGTNTGAQIPNATPKIGEHS